MAEEISFEEIKNVFALRGKNAGCSLKLRGKVVLVAFLINDGESGWSKETEKLFADNLKQISKDLMDKSGLSRDELEIAYAFCQVSVPYIVDKRNVDRFVKDVLRQFGTYPDIQAYQKHYEDKFSRDEACVSFVFNKKFRSYAVKIEGAAGAQTENPEGNEYSIVSFDVQDPETGRKTFIHELMHQFGAVDYYYPEFVKLKAEYYLPGSIMNDGTEIDDVTRYVIGWDAELTQTAKEFLKSVARVSDADRRSALREEWEN
ncbi:MAG: hypothetical protein E7447_00560 [Ruminococcaceae bacterium]|nr:hypothetical protein [Oscillospiraceae bacterium]